MGNYPFPNDDEGTYLAQAWAVQHGRGLAHYTYWYDHPPLGWIQLAAVSWLPAWLMPGSPTLVQGRAAMLVVAAGTALLVHLVARRSGVSRPAAAGAMLLLGLSPLAITLQRQVYLDAFATFWALAAFALALSPRRHLWHHFSAGVAFAAAILSKETIAVLLPALLLALWQRTHPRTRVFSVAGFLSGLVMTVLFYPLYATLKGELLPGAGHVSLLGTLRFQLGGRQGSGSAFETGTDANNLIHGWLSSDPLLLAGGCAAAVAALFVRRLRPTGLAVALLVLVALRPGGYLPQMYVVQLLPFLALALAGAADALVRALPRRYVWRLPAVAALLASAVLAFGPHNVRQTRQALTARQNGVYHEAAAWLRAGHVQDAPRTRVVTDGVLWLDAVDAGFTPHRVIWHYKLDQDPAVAASLPHGWRDIDYVVSTPALRGERDNLPTLRTLFARSEAIATFGEGGGRIDVLKVLKGDR
ncbi:hypothetical protein CTZ27_10895 [Streptomyces griseocarneus]|nr:hypothetical protein CTZ27_10895 [Streptomyces griseocarneus]